MREYLTLVGPALRVLALTCSFLACDIGGPSPVPPVTQQDQPSTCRREEVPRYLELREPYVQQARHTYPDARSRYEAGLPSGHRFFLTTALRQPNGGAELVFIEVSQIKGGIV